MSHIPLTPAIVETLASPAKGQIDYWDGALPGFGIRLSQGGTKSWVVMLRREKRKVRVTLGTYPQLSLEAARAKARDLLVQQADGDRTATGLAMGRESRDDYRPVQPVRGTAPVREADPELNRTAARLISLMGNLLDSDTSIQNNPTPRRPSSFEEPSALPFRESRMVAANAPEAKAPAPVAATPARAADRKRRILLVEDTELNRLVTLAMLGTGNYTVDSAASGLEALDALKDVHYDLVLMDVSMPNMDGFEATRAIRAMDGPMSRVPIVAMTAHAMVGDRERCLASGMDDYLPKPVSRADLLAKVEHFVSHGRNPESVAGGPEADRVIDERTLEALTADTNPDTLRGLVETMLPEMNKRLDAIEAGCANRDVTAVSHGAHSLKSMAATFGARAVERLAQAIEDLARSGNLGEAADLVSPLRAAATRADEALRKVRASA